MSSKDARSWSYKGGVRVRQIRVVCCDDSFIRIKHGHCDIPENIDGFERSMKIAYDVKINDVEMLVCLIPITDENKTLMFVSDRETLKWRLSSILDADIGTYGVTSCVEKDLVIVVFNQSILECTAGGFKLKKANGLIKKPMAVVKTKETIILTYTDTTPFLYFVRGADEWYGYKIHPLTYWATRNGVIIRYVTDTRLGTLKLFTTTDGFMWLVTTLSLPPVDVGVVCNGCSFVEKCEENGSMGILFSLKPRVTFSENGNIPPTTFFVKTDDFRIWE